MDSPFLKPVNGLGDSHLIISGRKGDLEGLRNIYADLLTRGVSANDIRKIFAGHCNRIGKTVLHEAAQNSQEECVRFLLDLQNGVGMDPDCLKQGDWTPLMLACTKKSLNVIRTLIEAGASTKLRNKDGWTPFHIACREGHQEIITYLLSMDSSNLWRTTSKNGRTPLHTAALYGHEEVVKTLLDAGCGVDVTDNCGSTPLMDALRAGCIQVAKRLVEAKADPYKYDSVGRQVIHLVAQAGREDSLDFLVQLLSAHNPPSTTSNHEATSEFVNVRTNDQSQLTPAHFAAKEGHVAVLKKLKSYGACLFTKDSKGRSPLHMATSSGRFHCVEFLLRAGAEDTPDDQGLRPSELAKTNELKRLFESGSL